MAYARPASGDVALDDYQASRDVQEVCDFQRWDENRVLDDENALQLCIRRASISEQCRRVLRRNDQARGGEERRWEV